MGIDAFISAASPLRLDREAQSQSSNADVVRQVSFDACSGVGKVCRAHELHRIRRSSKEPQVDVLVGATAIMGFEPLQICSERKLVMRSHRSVANDLKLCPGLKSSVVGGFGQ